MDYCMIYHHTVNDKVFSPFHEGCIFMKLRENLTLAKISEFTVKSQLAIR